MRLARLSLLVLSFALSLAAFAQSVRWEAGDSGDPADLQLVFEGCEPVGTPQLPTVEGISFSLAGTGTRTEMNNFSFTRFTILSYRVRARSAGPLQIPAFNVKTDKGSIRVAAYKSSLNTSTDLQSLATAQLKIDGDTPYVGQVFPLAYTLSVPRRHLNQIASNVAWNSAPLVAEDWGSPQQSETLVSGERQFNLAYNTRAYAKTPGHFTLEPTAQNVNLQTGSIGFGLFQAPRIESATINSNRAEVDIRPLPSPAPAGFSGAVGDFKLTSKIVPATAAIGEPVTWTLELSGTGNWPDIAGLPSREVSKDFQVVQPQAKRAPAEGKLFDATLTEDVVLVPTKAGTYRLAPVSFVYFDPKSGSYKTLTPPVGTVTITPPAAPKFNVTPDNPAAPSTPAPAVTAPARLPVSPELPAGLPRDDLPGSDPVARPWSWALLRWLLVLPVALIVAAWLAFAAHRGWQRDAHRPRRLALRRVRATLARLRHAPAAEQPALLRAWQTDVAALWPLASAAPRSDALADPAWETLWREVDRALYAADAPLALPPDWVARAEAAAASKRVPRFAPHRALRHLLPALGVVAVLLVFAAPSLRADQPADAYRRGDFAAAEKLWRVAVQQHPTDWIARHNLSLALAQQDRWQEAVAHATAALVQHPSSPAVRWQFAVACDKAGYTPAGFSPFINAGTKHQIARLASPATWQWVLLGAGVLFALAIIGWLARAYGFLASGVWRGARWLAFAASLVLGVAAVSSVRGYGDAGNPGAVLVWRNTTLRSIPTEADTAQKTIALPAGSFAVIDKTFLAGNWVRLAFSNGQTGWVRREEVVALWR